MKYAQVSYFYPTSDLSKSLKMPKGGFAVTVVGDDCCAVKGYKTHGFTTREDAFQYVESCALPYSRYSYTPELPNSFLRPPVPRSSKTVR